MRRAWLARTATVVVSVVVLSACSGAEPSTQPPTPPADTAPRLQTGGGAHDAASPAQPAATAAADRNLAEVLPRIYSLDACRLVRVAGGVPTRLGQHGCENSGRTPFRVWLVQKFDEANRFRAQRRVVNGVLTYHARPFMFSYCGAAYLPFSQEFAIGITIAGNNPAHCRTMPRRVDRISKALVENPAALQAVQPGRNNLSPCAVLTRVQPPRRGEEVRPQGSSGEALCEVGPSTAEDRWGPVPTVGVRARLVERPGAVVVSVADTRPVSCVVTGPGWSVPPEGTGRSQVELTVQVRGSCAQARAVFQRYRNQMLHLTPGQPSLAGRHRFWYLGTENDGTRSGTCRDVRPERGVMCGPALTVAVPEPKNLIAAASQQPDVLCAVTRTLVVEHFSELTGTDVLRPTRVGSVPRCVYTEPTHQLQLEVLADPDAELWGEPDDGLVVEPSSLQVSQQTSVAVGTGKRGALVLVLTAGDYVDSDQVGALLAPMARDLGRQYLLAQE